MIGQDLQKQVEIHQIRLEMYTTEKDYLVKQMMGGPSDIKPIDYSCMPHGSSRVVSVDRDWESIRKLQDRIDLEQWAIDTLSSQLLGIDKKIAELKGLDAQVISLRDFKGMTLQGIADLLGYSIDRIKQVSCKNPRIIV